MKSKFKRNKLVISWAVSYLAILLATAVFNFYTYIRIEDSMLEQIDKINIELLQNKKQYIDNFQIIVNNLAGQIAYDPLVREMALRQSADDTYKYDMLAVREKIESWRYSDVEISNIYVYFHNTDYIVGGAANTSSERYYKTYYSDKNMSYEEYLGYLTQKHYSKYVFIPDNTGGSLLYFTTVFGFDYTTPLATVVAEIKTDEWMDAVSEDVEEKLFCISDGSNNIIYKNGGTDFSLQTLELDADNAVKMDNMGGSVILYTKSGQNDWVYIYSIYNKQYTAVINKMRVRTGAIMLLWLAVGIYATAFFVRRQHRPIRGLITRLEKNMGGDFSESRNEDEIIFINEWITKFIDEKNREKSRAETQNLILRDAILQKLMTEADSDFLVTAETSLENLGCRLELKDFAVMMFWFEDLSEMFFETNPDGNDDNYGLAKLIVSNILAEVIPEECKSLFCDVGGMLCCILNMEGDCSFAAVQAVEKVQEIIRENFNIEFVAGMSGVHTGLASLMLCRNEALQCIECGFAEPEQVIVYSNITKAFDKMYYFPIEKEMGMINCLKSGDFETAQKLLDDILYVNIEQNKISIQKAKCLMYDIVCTVMKAQSDLDFPEGGVIEQDEILKRIDNVVTVKRLRIELNEIFREICSRSKYKQSRHIAEVVSEVKEYIDSYYDDSSLNGAAIAKHFYMNQSYLSTIFKKSVNCGMLEYLARVRISKAMELLKASDQSIETISENVGFANVRTFTRVFSKYTGMSPSKFRDK